MLCITNYIDVHPSHILPTLPPYLSLFLSVFLSTSISLSLPLLLPPSLSLSIPPSLSYSLPPSLSLPPPTHITFSLHHYHHPPLIFSSTYPIRQHVSISGALSLMLCTGTFIMAYAAFSSIVVLDGGLPFVVAATFRSQFSCPSGRSASNGPTRVTCPLGVIVNLSLLSLYNGPTREYVDCGSVDTYNRQVTLTGSKVNNEDYRSITRTVTLHVAGSTESPNPFPCPPSLFSLFSWHVSFNYHNFCSSV